MKRFRFRLARLRRVREQEEKLARGDLARAMAGLDAAERQAAAADAFFRDCREHERGGGSAQALAAAFLRQLDATRAVAQQRVGAASRGVEVARHVYLQRRTASAVLERLYDRRRLAWGSEFARHEQAEQEELARVARAPMHGAVAGGAIGSEA